MTLISGRRVPELLEKIDLLLEEPEQQLGEKSDREEDRNDELQDREYFVLLQSVSLLSEGPE